MSIFFKSFDPFVPFENLNAAIFFGGILDALRKAAGSKQAGVKSKDALFRHGTTPVVKNGQ